ncbi:hypothetical protein TH0211_09350 [Helicobacter pylori]
MGLKWGERFQSASYPFKKIKQNFKNFKKMSFYNKMGVKMIKQSFKTPFLK